MPRKTKEKTTADRLDAIAEELRVKTVNHIASLKDAICEIRCTVARVEMEIEWIAEEMRKGACKTGPRA